MSPRAALLTAALVWSGLAWGGPVQCGVALQRELGLEPNFTTMTSLSVSLEGKDPELVSAVLMIGAIESGLNPKAARGAAGEVGMFQILPGTARWAARRCGVVGSPRLAAVGAQLAYCYLDYLRGVAGGELELAVVGYNAGEKYIPVAQRYGALPKVTAQYLFKFNRLRRRVKECSQ